MGSDERRPQVRARACVLSIVFAKQFWHSWHITVVDDHHNFQVHTNYLTECLARKK